MKLKVLLLALTGLLIRFDGQAQSTLSFLYSISVPLGDTKDFIDEPSFRGATFEFHNYVKTHISVGAAIGWYAFYQRNSESTYTLHDDALAVSGVQYRYMNSIPVLILADYHFRPDEFISPFAGIGIGTTYNQLDLKMGLYQAELSTWHFTLAPEVGAQIGSTKDGHFAGLISARYNQNFSTSEIDTQSYLSLNVGFLIEF